jgi:hypothetical protein
MRARFFAHAVVTLALLAGAAGVAPAPAATPRVIDYHGLRLPVPAGWPVVDLDSHPDTCARVDHHAIYLGTPAARADCPAHISGRTETVSVAPVTGQVSPEVAIDRVSRTGIPAPTRSPGGSSTVALSDAGLLLTMTYGDDPASIDSVLAAASLTPEARAVALRHRPEAVAEAVSVPGAFTGYGFDACQAPTSAVMDQWLSSAYRAVGVYLGGGDLGCPNQPNLTSDWVARQAGRGWHVFPLYVGRQAPCSTEPFRITDPSHQGQQDADDAAVKAQALGMAKGSVIYQDMEYYKRGGACSTAVLTYLTTWTTTLHADGYRSGVYSSRSAAIDDLTSVVGNGAYRVPDHIDFASWDNRATTADPNIPASYWSRHQRIKQYAGGHNENHGGTTINVDSNWLDVG